MKIYKVGGYVRDKIMGIKPHDIDYCVVGSSIDEMLSLGYKQVGKDFPVFLHPVSGDEYALARTERKIGDKHTDFAFDFDKNITLENDLCRRDFTCNALAEDEDGNIIDLFGGIDDMKNKILRVVDKEHFIEDPLRIVRAFRFCSQLGFTIENESLNLIKTMVKDGMLNHLTIERIEKELMKALSSGYDSVRFFETMNECGTLEILFPEIYRLTNSPEQLKYHHSGNSFKHTMIALDRVRNESPIIKFAVLVHDLGKGTTPKEILPKHINHDVRGIQIIEDLCNRLKIPNDYKKFAKTFCEYHMRMANMLEMSLKKQYDITSVLSNGFKNKCLLEDYMKCFYADFYGEEVLSEYADEKVFNNIVKRFNDIEYVLDNITVDKLPIETQEILKRYSGKKFGNLLRDYKIKFLRDNLK